MKTIILNQRKERDELMSRPYLIRKSIQDTDLLLSSHLIKLITGPRRVGKSIIDVARQEFRISELRQLSITGNLGCESGHADAG